MNNGVSLAKQAKQRVESGKRVIDLIDKKYDDYQRRVLDAAIILLHRNLLAGGHHREFVMDVAGSDWFNNWTPNQIAHLNNVLKSERYKDFLDKLGLEIIPMDKQNNVISYDAHSDAIVILTINKNGRAAVIQWQDYYADHKNPNRFLVPAQMLGNPDEFAKHFSDAGFVMDEKAKALFQTLQSDIIIEDEDVVIGINMPEDIKEAIADLWDVEEQEDGSMRVPLTPELMDLLNQKKAGIKFTPEQQERMQRWLIENEAIQDELRAKAAEALAYLDTCGDWKNPRIMNNEGKYAPTPLRDFQVEAIEKIAGKEFFLFAAGRGAGKTITAYIAAMGLRRGRKVPIIIISPKSVVNGWRDTVRELQKQFPMWPSPIRIFTWDSIPEEGKKGWLLEDYDEVIVIADEVHNIKNMTSRRFKRASAFLRHKAVSGVIALTGTPVPNGRASEIFPILHVLNHPLAAMGKQEFLKKYSTTKNLPKLRAAYSDAVYYVDISKVKLPPVVNNFIRVPMTRENAERYDSFLQPRITEYEESIRNGTRSKKSAAMFLVNSARHASSEAKISEAIAMAQDMYTEGRTALIFAEYRDTVTAIYDGIYSFTHKVAMITGDSSANERSRVVEQTKTGEVDFVVATAASVGEGLNGFQFRIHDLIFVDYRWSGGAIDQNIGRLQRGGQKETTNVYWLEFSPLDVAIAQLVTRKMERVMLMGFADKNIVARNNADDASEESDLEILGSVAAQGLRFSE